MLFHITTGAAWQAARARGRYEADSLRTEGFIHCSERHQVEWVANTRFHGRSDLVLLLIEAAMLQAEVRYENLEGGDQRFPHVYGAIPVGAVVRVLPMLPDPGGSFSLGDLRVEDSGHEARG
jgi:uncharacterized protein (DUF952 family)